MSASPRVLMIGLDGGTPDLISLWVSQGKLPTIGKLIQNGAWGTLLSTTPPMSPPAWVSLMTGLNPGKHGVFLWEPLSLDNQTPDLPPPFDSSQFAGTTIFDLLTSCGLRSVAYRVPMTYPAWSINGIMVSGYPGPCRVADRAIAYVGRFPGIEDYPDYDDFRASVRASDPDRLDSEQDMLIKWYKLTIQRDCRSICHLLQDVEWDFFAAVFSVTDDVQHHFWQYMHPVDGVTPPRDIEKYGDAIYQIYSQVDQAIKDMLAQTPEDTLVFLVSDHGARAAPDRLLHLNRWLF